MKLTDDTQAVGNLKSRQGIMLRPEVSGRIPVVTSSFVRAAHRANVQVHVWTINDTAEMQRFLDMGVDGIMTDKPAEMLALIGR